MIKSTATIMFLCFSVFYARSQNYTQYVNPFIGTGGHGHTFPGATVPHGMMQLSPDTRLTGWDGCSGYHYSDTFIYGFTHTHLSGTGVSDYGDILVMPTTGEPSSNNKIYGSAFKHSNESASPGYYKVKLEDDNIHAEFTTTERSGMHHYTFAKTGEQNIILDLIHRDEAIESSLTVEDSFTISGLRRSKAWAEDQFVFFVIKFSRPINAYGIWQNDTLATHASSSTSRHIKAFFRFNLNDNPDLFVKVALSPVSVDGAKRNLEAEITGWDFEKIKKEAEQKWEAELAKIEIRSEDKEKLTIFYTALYHTAIAPNIYMDVDGLYRGRDLKIHKADGFVYYSVFSLWDTYRATHPLFTIIDTRRTLDYIKTFLAQYKEGGKLPVWELSGNETNCMIGYHAVSVITDAYAKGIVEFDTATALAAMRHSATYEERGLPEYIKNGVIEVDDEAESVSKVLEYAYDDWCIAEFARLIGNENVYLEYIKRAQHYKNVLDVRTGFMRPRKNGGWLSPFDPREVNNHFTEANSWQYSFYFPQDIGGYTSLTGGAPKLGSKLDSLFAASTQTTGREQSDITGMIGQYAHGNEPSHHIIYLYNYAGKENKTQHYVHKVMNEMYKNEPDGLIGNEDCGQMSAWYVLSALGFYPVTPGSTNYLVGTPQFPLAQINLENDRTFIINAPGVNDSSFYIQSGLLSTTASLMPKKMMSSMLRHQDIANGGLVTFMMGSKPAAAFPQKLVSSRLSDYKGKNIKIVINPSINGGGISFKGNKRISISSPEKGVRIFYTMDGTEPTLKSKRYASPLVISNTVTVKAIAANAAGHMSKVTTAAYKKNLNDFRVSLKTPYEQQYNGGGADGLVDGIHGSIDWRKGNWQGYQKNDMEVLVDLKQAKKVSKIITGFLQDAQSWIILPKEFSIEYSTDGKTFQQLYKGKEFLAADNLEPQIMKIEPSFSPVTARYIRFKAIQFGKMPDDMPGAGGDTHIFIDEIEIQ